VGDDSGVWSPPLGLGNGAAVAKENVDASVGSTVVPLLVPQLSNSKHASPDAH